jgi:CrcB protein
MAGSVARYLLATWVMKVAGPGFPLGTLTVNLVGSLLLGVVMAIALHGDSIGPGLQLGLTTGLLGGFTTYSAFNFETLRLLEQRAWLLAGLNVASTLAGCLVAGWLGWAGAAWVLGGRAR